MTVIKKMLYLVNLSCFEDVLERVRSQISPGSSKKRLINQIHFSKYMVLVCRSLYKGAQLLNFHYLNLGVPCNHENKTRTRRSYELHGQKFSILSFLKSTNKMLITKS